MWTCGTATGTCAGNDADNRSGDYWLMLDGQEMAVEDEHKDEDERDDVQVQEGR